MPLTAAVVVTGAFPPRLRRHALSCSARFWSAPTERAPAHSRPLKEFLRNEIYAVAMTLPEM